MQFIKWGSVYLSTYPLYPPTFFDRHEERYHIARKAASSPCRDMRTYARMRIFRVCTCVHVSVNVRENEWVNAYARRVWSTGSTALCLCCLRRKATSANMWPDLASGRRGEVRGCVSHMGLPPAAIFPQGWFYCPRTRASCWNSKWSSRRDVTSSVREGSVKGEKEEVARDDSLRTENLRDIADTCKRPWSCTRRW